MRNIMSILRQKKLFRLIAGMAFLAVSFSLGAQSLWEGSAAIGSYGVLPVRGLYGASNSFPRNTLVKIENLENGESAEIIIVDRLENSSFLVLLSQEAGEELEIGPSGVIRVRATLGVAEKTDSYSLNNDQVYSEDPDINPAAGAEVSASDSADTEEILAMSVFPVDEPVAPLESEAALAAGDDETGSDEPEEPEQEPEPELVEESEPVDEPVVETMEIAEAEPAEPVVVTPEELEEPKTEEPIVIEEPELKITEKEPAVGDLKKDPVVDVAVESLETVVDMGEEDIAAGDLPEPEVETEDTAEIVEEPELEPVEYEPEAEPELTYVSGEMPAPSGDEEEAALESLNLPGIADGPGEETAGEDVLAWSLVPLKPAEASSDLPYSIPLPEVPDIAGKPAAADTGAGEIPVVETLYYLSAGEPEVIPEPILPVVTEYSAAAVVEEVTDEDVLLLVESGYSAPEMTALGTSATHLPDSPVKDSDTVLLAGESEVPDVINGYTEPGLERFAFGKAALPSDPTEIVAPVEMTEITDDAPALISGFVSPKEESLGYYLVALPEVPGTDMIAEEQAYEVPSVINGFVEPDTGDSVRFAGAEPPEEPASAEPDMPTLVNGFVEPESEVMGEFAEADVPAVPEGPVGTGPETINGYVDPDDVDSEEFASATAPEEPEFVDEETPSTVDGYAEPGEEEPVELAAADEPEIEDTPAEEEPEGEKIEIEVPPYEGDIEISLSPAEERPPEVVEIPEVVEGAEGPETVPEEIETAEIAEADVPEKPETAAEELPSLDEILGADEPEPETAAEPEPAEEPEPEVEIAEAVSEPETQAEVPAPVVKTLEQGYHYIQVGVYGDKTGASTAVNSIKGWSPVPVVVWTPESAAGRYKVMVGPLTPDESGVMLFNLKGKGYRDAFLRKVMEPN